MSRLRTFITRGLARLFDDTPVPSSFAAVCSTPAKNLVIAPSETWIVEAMLWSFARRSGLKRPAYLGSAIPLEPNQFQWAGLSAQDLIAKEVAENSEIRITTLNIFHLRGPVKSNPSYRMGLLKLISLLPARKLLVIVFGAPFHVASGVAQHPRQVMRRIKMDFYANLKLVRGLPFQSIETQADIILSGNEVSREMSIIAARTNEPIGHVRRKARSAFFKMAASPKGPMYSAANFFCRLTINRLFSQVITTGLDELAPAVRQHTVVIVPMHRSHLDYLLLGYELYEANFNPPLVAAGVNLSFWPFGYLIRSVGGYFVKRDARNDRIHAMLLRRYVSYLINRGHMQEFFIEGGRSRSGKMRQPRLGLLSIIVSSFLKGTKRDILFVPTSITYENVVEDKSFGDENTGRSKQKENLINLLRARKIFAKTYGEVILNFGKPISLKKFIEDSPANRPDSKAPEERTIVQSLAAKISSSIRTQANVSLTGIAYTALLMAPAYGLRREDLLATIRGLADTARLLRQINPEIGKFTPTLESLLAGRQHILDTISRGGVSEVQRCLGQEVFYIPGKKRFTADFYKNSTIHLFFLPALLGLAQLMDGSVQPETTKKLYTLFQYDFQLPEHAIFYAETTSFFEEFSKARLVSGNRDNFQFCNTSPGNFIPALLQSSVQAMLWVCRALGELPSDDPSDNKGPALLTFNYDDFLERLQNDFRSGMYLGLASRTEASSQSALMAAIDSLKSVQILGVDDSGRSGKSLQLLRRPDAELALLAKADKALREWQLQQAEALALTPQLLGGPKA